MHEIRLIRLITEQVFSVSAMRKIFTYCLKASLQGGKRLQNGIINTKVRKEPSPILCGDKNL